MADLISMPKVLLHEHLDGSLREETLLDLLHARGIVPPADDAHSLGRWFDDRAHAGSLVEYLRGFALTVAAMASPSALSRVAYEAAEDAIASGCVLAEFRIAPLLFEPLGVPGDAAVEALLDGLARSTLPCGLIVCAMRHLPPTETARAAALAARWAGRGVVAFDLAGAEHGHPPSEHREALAIAREAGLGLTLHAGEADEAVRVIEAARLGATRVGHGVRLADALADPSREWMVEEACARDVHFEVCPTSNVHTGAAPSIAGHPISTLWHAGLSVGFNTDNRLMSRISLESEAGALLNDTTLGIGDLVGMGLEAARHSFLGAAAREQAAHAVRDWARVNGIETKTPQP